MRPILTKEATSRAQGITKPVFTAHRQRNDAELAGTARLGAVAAAALAYYLAIAIASYLMPLLLPARGFPADAWETWGLYGILSWIAGAPLAGALGNRLGERVTWALGSLLCAIAALLPLLYDAGGPWAGAWLRLNAFTFGLSGALVWVGGISLAQATPPARRGLSNILMLTSVAIGAVAAPALGRLLIDGGDAVMPRFTALPWAGFIPALLLSALIALGGAATILRYGQHPRAPGAPAPVRRPTGHTRAATLALLRQPGFLLAVIPLSLLASPVFQAMNIYLAYRAGEPGIGLIAGARDQGWALLQTVNAAMSCAGGLLVGPIAGRRVTLRGVALLLALFALCGLGVGLAPSAGWLFAAGGLFEVGRQLNRWAQTGYLAQRLPDEQRPIAIGLSVTASSVGGALFAVGMRRLQSPSLPGFSSALPFILATIIAGAGALWLALQRERTEQDG